MKNRVQKRIIFGTFGILFTLLFLNCNNNSTREDNSTSDWNIFRGNEALTAYTDISLPDNPVLLWEFKSGSYTKSSPVVHNRVVYWSSRRGRIFGVNIEGKQVFDYAMETAVDATPIIYDSTLYTGRIDGRLCAISLSKQDTLWTYETWGQIIASPNRISYNGKEAIVVGSYDNYLYIIDSKTGKKINRFESGYYINGAVAQYDNYAIFGGCDAWLRIVNCLSGVQTDSLELESYIPASPAIHDNRCYIADHAGNVYEIEIYHGKIVSSQKIIKPKDENGRLLSVPAVSDKMVYIVSDDRNLYAINRGNETASRQAGRDAACHIFAIAWKYLLKGDTGESSPVVCKNKLIVCTKTGIVSIFNAKNGNLLWEYDTGEQITASPAVINGYFFILTAKGTLFCFK